MNLIYKSNGKFFILNSINKSINLKIIRFIKFLFQVLILNNWITKMHKFKFFELLNIRQK